MQGKALQIAELIRPSVEALDVELWGVDYPARKVEAGDLYRA